MLFSVVLHNESSGLADEIESTDPPVFIEDTLLQQEVMVEASIREYQAQERFHARTRPDACETERAAKIPDSASRGTRDFGELGNPRRSPQVRVVIRSLVGDEEVDRDHEFADREQRSCLLQRLGRSGDR